MNKIITAAISVLTMLSISITVSGNSPAEKGTDYAGALQNALEEAQPYLEDAGDIASDFADQLASDYKSYTYAGYSYASFGKYAVKQENALDKDIAALQSIQKQLAESSGESLSEDEKKLEKAWEEYNSEAFACMRSMRELIDFTINRYAINQMLLEGMQNTDYENKVDYLYAAFDCLTDSMDALETVEAPPAIGSLWDCYQSKMAGMEECMRSQYQAFSYDDVLAQYTAIQLVERSSEFFSDYDGRMVSQTGIAMAHARNILTERLAGKRSRMIEVCGNLSKADTLSDSDISVTAEYDLIDEVMPNVYPSTDSAVNLTLYTDHGTKDVLISIVINGFTQTYERKMTVTPEAAFYMIKPPVLTDLPDLGSSRETQLRMEVKEAGMGHVIAQESKTITLESVYDYRIYTDDFGFVTNDNILAWLTPESEGMLTLRRKAADWLGSVLGDSYAVLPGYQSSYGYDAGDANIAYFQAAALQVALSDLGVRYVNGSYSFVDDQRVLTPDAVLAGGSGICIETSILMASALMSAGMHPCIIFTPGHAQVAIETWHDSHQYLLLETTMLPFEATETELDRFARLYSNEDWAAYLSEKEQEAASDGGFVYVVDCDLKQTLGMKGLNYTQPVRRLEDNSSDQTAGYTGVWAAQTALASSNLSDIENIRFSLSTEGGVRSAEVTDPESIRTICQLLSAITLEAPSDEASSDDGLHVEICFPAEKLSFSFEGNTLVMDDGSRHKTDALYPLRKYLEDILVDEEEQRRIGSDIPLKYR